MTFITMLRGVALLANRAFNEGILATFIGLTNLLMRDIDSLQVKAFVAISAFVVGICEVDVLSLMNSLVTIE